MTDTATTENGKATARDREYVVGGGYWWYRGQQSRALALPWAIDDLTQDFGPDLYERMLDDVLWDMLGSMALGNRVAEITYHPFDRSPLPGRAVLRSLTVKPRESLAFVVD